ncbi:MAG TPA: hypothetical protein GXZ43_02115 [Clostridiaceae bacterium]|nr:hypothetical protein [Clostridiaceae bacterium]
MTNEIICSRCNNPIESTLRFCKYCGQPVQQELNQSQNQYPGKNRSNPQPHYQFKYGTPVSVNHPDQQHAGQYLIRQPMNLGGESSLGDNHSKKKSNKKKIIIISTVTAVVVFAVVFFVFILPGLVRSPEKTAEQLKNAILTGDMESVYDCYDAASLPELYVGLADYMENPSKYKYTYVDIIVLQVYDTGLSKNQCIVTLDLYLSSDEIRELEKFQQFINLEENMTISNGILKTREHLAMVKEGNKWKFSIPLTERLSDYIDMLN